MLKLAPRTEKAVKEREVNPLRKLVLAASFLIFSQASMAAFVVRDLHVVGDGLLTFDSVTNLEWLDVTASVGRSYNDVATQLGGGVTLLDFTTRRSVKWKSYIRMRG